MLINFYKAYFIVEAHIIVRSVFQTNKFMTLVPRSKVHLSYRPIQFYNGQPEIFRIIVARFLDGFDSIFNVLIVVFCFQRLRHALLTTSKCLNPRVWKVSLSPRKGAFSRSREFVEGLSFGLTAS